MPFVHDWFAATRGAGGVELRPHPRLLRRFARGAAVVNGTLAFLAFQAAVGGFGFLAVIAAVAAAPELVRVIEAAPLFRTAAVAAVLAAEGLAVAGTVFAAKKTYAKALQEQGEPLLVAADGAVSREGKEYIRGGSARGVCVERFTDYSGEGSCLCYRVCVIDRDGFHCRVPCPDPILGVWIDETTNPRAAKAFANLLGEVLAVPVRPKFIAAISD